MSPVARVVCALFPASLPELAKYAEATLRFTPQVALRGSEAVFLDITASRHLVREETLALKLGSLARRLGFPAPRVAIGPTPGAALAAARFGGARLPLAALRDFADPFASDEKTALRADGIAEILRGLGLAEIADLSRLPRETLVARLGAESLELARQIQGEKAPAWPIYRPPERIQESVSLLDVESLDSGGADLEALLFFAKQALDRVFARLHARARRLGSFELRLRLERGEERAWEIELAIAQSSPRAVLAILRERLRFELARAPLEAPVAQLGCEVRETAPGHGAQRDFFCAKEERREAQDAFFARLAARLGDGQVYVAAAEDRYPPEGAWRKAKPDTPGEQMALGGRRLPRRPLRLLETPERARELGEVLQLASGRRYAIARRLGPERIQAEWWDERPVRRDYFELETREGPRLWVFHEGGRIYLQGHFD